MLPRSSPQGVLGAFLNMNDPAERAGQELERFLAFFLVAVVSVLQLLFIRSGPQLRGLNLSFLPRVSRLAGVGHSVTPSKSTSWELASYELLLVS